MYRIFLMLILIISFTSAAKSEFITELSDANFQKEVIESETAVLVDFWAPWCGPCKKLGPIFEELSTEHHQDIKFAKLNVDNNKQIAGKYGIRSIPTVGIFKNGKPVDGFIGMRSKDQIKEIIKKHFSEKNKDTFEENKLNSVLKQKSENKTK